jgi:predicted AAA+ superfamily ATPase
MSKSLPSFQRSQVEVLKVRLGEPRKFIQVIAGPRQVGKTTIALQAANLLSIDHHYVSADGPTLQKSSWLTQQWEVARLLAKKTNANEAVLIVDEVQKIPNWSETVKQLWDADSADGTKLKVVLLGSAPLLVQHGLTESLMGRFEVIRVPHWSFLEMRECFGYTVDQYIMYGSYPGSATIVQDHERWVHYILESIIEPTISKDVLLLSRVDKPILLRLLFELSCAYSGQLLSYTKMLGELDGVGNTVTLAHYLQLLSGAGMVQGLQKFSNATVRTRNSIPKLQVFNTALMSALHGNTMNQAKSDPAYWVRLTESAIGAHLANAAVIGDCELFYWRDRNKEVDFVLRKGSDVIAIEVGSGVRKKITLGMKQFEKQFKPVKSLLVGPSGIGIESFLLQPVKSWFEKM